MDRCKSIQISKGAFGIKAATALVRLMAHHGRNFVELKFIDVDISANGADLILRSLGHTSYLETFWLTHFRFSESLFTLFTAYFRHNQHLRDLSVTQASGLRVECWTTFMEALAHNKLLRAVDLSHCNFIEDQRQADKKLKNPYYVYKVVKEKFAKMPPGIKWPGGLIDA